MQGQENKARRKMRLRHYMLYILTAIICPASLAHANALSKENIQAFYEQWTKIQQQNIPAQRDWLTSHLHENIKINILLTAKAPDIWSHALRKKVKLNAEKAQDLMIQIAQIHSHKDINAELISLEITEDHKRADLQIEFSAAGMSVLPRGKHGTTRVRTEITARCDDQLILNDSNIIQIKRSQCEVMTVSRDPSALRAERLAKQTEAENE